MNAERSSNDPQQQWSVQAQFTISHPGIDNHNNAPKTHMEHDNEGVHMFYSWNSHTDHVGTVNKPDKSQANYKFQKGNLHFTSESPRKNQSSGYGSEILCSPNSSTHMPISEKPTQLHNQKCRSTCSIVLSTTINEQPEFEEAESLSGSQTLKCEIPQTNLGHPTSYYGCGDPWYYHSDASNIKGFTTASTYSPSYFENRLKDAAVQTFEMVDKCTSPFLKEGSPLALKKHSHTNTTNKPIVRKSSHSSFTADSLENYKPRQHSLRSVRPSISSRSSKTESKSNDSNKKSRTVHIDVYCTGTEQESDSNSSSDIESKTASSPQTVFESEKLKVTHSRSANKILPLNLQDDSSKDSLPKSDSKVENNDSDDDNTSTAYPSQISSYSALAGLSSFASTIPSSWSTYSIDNVNTSWKDTFSDIDSLNPSRSSIALTDSLEFPFRKHILSQKSESIEEHPKILENESNTNLKPSDSFEYENTEDKLRIKQKEKNWNKPMLHWKSSELERSKHLLQQQKLREYVEKRFRGINLQKSESKDSDSGSDISEKGWSFVKDEDKSQQLTVDTVPIQSGSKRSPSVMAIQAKLSINPNLHAPFMLDPGVYTKQRNVAKRFGSVIDVFRKPGHHIGPAKNPECQCDHCREHYQTFMRGRTRSAGDVYPPWMSWRKNSKQLHFQDETAKK